MAAFEICVAFVLILLVALALFYFVTVFNGLIVLRNNIDKAWANIDVLLKQRADLVPSLVEIVKAYTKYEKEMFENLSKIRAGLLEMHGPVEKAKTNSELNKSLLAVVENYPKLQANENFLKLQAQLSDLENQIADRRNFYNESVLLFNTRIQIFPDSIFALFLNMRKKEFFKAFT